MADMSHRRHDLAFLHTSPVHIKTFGDLVQELSPGLAVFHHVDESLLRDARNLGMDDAGLRQRVEQAMQAAAATGAGMVVCTCSSIGAIAERMGKRGGFSAARIDRAMAERAVALGPRILLVAALESTLLPTTELLQESAMVADKPIAITTLLVEAAWAHFQNGDKTAYVQTIVQTIRQYLRADVLADVRANEAAIDVVVLAQASMAAVADELTCLGKPVLSSLRLGLHATISSLQQDSG